MGTVRPLGPGAGEGQHTSLAHDYRCRPGSRSECPINGVGINDIGLHAHVRSMTQDCSDDQRAVFRLIPKQTSEASGAPAPLHYA
jgi:hypothetical protein